MGEPIRILQVVSQMGPSGGGVEAWLLQVLRHIDRDQFRMDFLVHNPEPKAFDDEVRSLGSRVLPCVRPLFLWKYPSAFRDILRRHGPYDIVHSHVLFSGLVIRLAKWYGVPARIAHSHSDVEGFRVDGDPLRGPVVRCTNRWARTAATVRLACSQVAGAALFGANGRATDWRVLYYGIDLGPFERPIARSALRAELGLPPEALVVGHVGRFQEQKNHAFLIEIAAEMVRRRPQVRLLLVGDGPLRPVIEQKAHQAGLGDHVSFLGLRQDVAQLMTGAMDVFVLPSHYEGLPLVGIEAQAAELPCVLSNVIAEELVVVPGLVRRLSLARPASEWADAIVAMAQQPKSFSPGEALAKVRASAFNIRNNVRKLESVYRECLGRLA